MSPVEDTINKIKAVREGGHTERCHTIPHHGSYSVGKHSYDAVSLLLILNPHPSPELVKAVLWHDVAERWVGDLPAPAKWYNPIVADTHRVCERRVEYKIGINTSDFLTEDEKVWLDEVDRLEVMLWALDQEAMGNKNVAHFPEVIYDYFEAKPFVHHEVMMVVQNAKQYWKRLPDRL